MGDSWEDWDDAPEPVVPGAAQAQAGAAAADKFVGEDEEEEEPKWKAQVPETQAAKEKKGLSKYDESKGVPRRRGGADDTPLDDPVAEKLRKQRLVEEADFAAARELFGGAGAELDAFVPKSLKDFEELGRLVAARHLSPHIRSNHYKAAVKALLKAALAAAPSGDVKDVETCVAGIRAERLKEEKAAAAAKGKGGKRATLNVGRDGGAAGLDDYIYDDAGPDDAYEFM